MVPPETTLDLSLKNIQSVSMTLETVICFRIFANYPSILTNNTVIECKHLKGHEKVLFGHPNITLLPQLWSGLRQLLP